MTWETEEEDLASAIGLLSAGSPADVRVAESLRGRLVAVRRAKEPKSGKHLCLVCGWMGWRSQTVERFACGFGPSLHDRDCPECGGVAPAVEDASSLESHLALKGAGLL